MGSQCENQSELYKTGRNNELIAEERWSETRVFTVCCACSLTSGVQAALRVVAEAHRRAERQSAGGRAALDRQLVHLRRQGQRTLLKITSHRANTRS